MKLYLLNNMYNKIYIYILTNDSLYPNSNNINIFEIIQFNTMARKAKSQSKNKKKIQILCNHQCFDQQIKKHQEIILLITVIMTIILQKIDSNISQTQYCQIVIAVRHFFTANINANIFSEDIVDTNYCRYKQYHCILANISQKLQVEVQGIQPLPPQQPHAVAQYFEYKKNESILKMQQNAVLDHIYVLKQQKLIFN
eukprot:TRINITY_DN726_c0_g4_i1.p1 TRINITY_DN726_c0_g4~~TRINITY_DN726_c0_g4_i1.p1  ORF type:complete len:198 (-),score=-6.83 TRINITY_DN726_c0_g4_i1:336-929(-)